MTGIPNRKQRVVIVAPGALATSPRVVKEADALWAAGFDVHVIATRTSARTDEGDASILKRIGWNARRIDLRARSTRWHLRLPQEVTRRAFAGFGVRALAERALHPWTRLLRSAATMHRADLYIAHYPAALPAVAAAAKRHEGHFAYDAEDFHLGDWPDDPAHDLDRRLVREIEGRYLPKCAFVTAASPMIADALETEYGIRRPNVLLNVFPLSQQPVFRERGCASPGPSVYWFSQTVGTDRGLECAIRAIALAKTRPHLYLRGTPSAGFEETAKQLANKVGAAGRLHFLSPGPPDDMERLASAYDLALSSETENRRARVVCLTNKIFTYLLAGVPPLMSATPAQAAFASEAGLRDQLYPLDDPLALAALMDRYLGDLDRLADARHRAWKLGDERYNWETESLKLITLVSQALAPLAAGREGVTAEPHRKVQKHVVG